MLSITAKLPAVAPAAVSPARREAFAILLAVERGSAHSDDLRGRRVSALSPADRNLCTTLVMGVLRRQLSLDAEVSRLLARPGARLDTEVSLALRLGAFQLLFLDRVPAHAAIHESVELAKQAGHRFAAGMVNAVLRKLAAGPRAVGELSAEAAIGAYPAWLVERWAAAYGPAVTRAICLHGQREATSAIRLSSPAVATELAAEGVVLTPGILLTAARMVAAGDVTATAAFRSGRVRLQEEGSQLIAELLAEAANRDGSGSNQPLRILDCCAAPGGKTLILAEQNAAATIAAGDASEQRLERLRRRIGDLEDRAVASRIELVQADAEKAADLPDFDLVLADVPCSGTGTLGRNPEIRYRLQPSDFARHHQRQVSILRAAMSRSRSRLLYSTCSLEAEENAAVVEEAVAATTGWRQVSLAGRIGELADAGRLTAVGAELLPRTLDAEGALLLLPGALPDGIETDGFFAAMLERKPT